MYNYSIKTTYLDLDDDKQDTQYRKELLQVFELAEYTNKINEHIDALYEKVKSQYQDVIQCVKNNDPMVMFRTLDENGCFMILFSWDFFYEHHQLLSAILSKQENISDMKNLLIEKIKRNKK